MNTRRLHAGAVIALAALALAACGSSNKSENVSATVTPGAAPTSATMSTPSNDVNAATTTSDAPQQDRQEAQTPDAPESPDAAPATSERGLPTSAGDYSEAFMQAWTGGDKAAMRTYANDSVVEQMSAVKPQGALLRTICEDTMCSYSEENGGRVTLTLDLAKVDSGAAKGITAVKLDL